VSAASIETLQVTNRVGPGYAGWDTAEQSARFGSARAIQSGWRSTSHVWWVHQDHLVPGGGGAEARVWTATSRSAGPAGWPTAPIEARPAWR